MKRAFLPLGIAAMCPQRVATPVAAQMSHDEKVGAAAALLGIAVLLHNKHHYKGGYSPATGTYAADFESCYPDGLHGTPFSESARDCAEGWQAGKADRETSAAHRQNTGAAQKAPPITVKGCAALLATNFAVGTQSVHLIKARSPSKHQWQIEASVGHEHTVCIMRDPGQVIPARSGRL